MRVRPRGQRGSDTDVLGRHDGAEIDKWMFGSAGKSEGGGREGAEWI